MRLNIIIIVLLQRKPKTSHKNVDMYEIRIRTKLAQMIDECVE